MKKSSLVTIRVLVSLLLVAVPLLSVIPIPWVVTNIDARTYTIYQLGTSTNYQINLFTGSQFLQSTLQIITYSTSYETSTESMYPCSTRYGPGKCGPWVQTITVQVPNQTRFTTITSTHMGTFSYPNGTVFYTTLTTSQGMIPVSYTETVTSMQIVPVTTGTITSSTTYTLRQTAILQAAEFLTFPSDLLFVVLLLLPLAVAATVIALTFLEREQVFCSRCNVRLRRGSRFCDSCGSSV